MTSIFLKISASAGPIGDRVVSFDQAFTVEQAYYIGRDYKNLKRHTSLYPTEILSMGMERLIVDPITFAERDPEFCSFILGILDGSLR
jgi:hypothetical protein